MTLVAPALLTLPNRTGGLAAFQAKPTLPAPSGPHKVGRTNIEWTDPVRGELYADEPGARRRLQAWIWYPATPAAGATVADYAPAGWEGVGEFWGFDWTGAVAHAYAEAPVADTTGQYPVILFIANGFPPFSHTAVIEDLASHGFVVAGVTNPYHVPVTSFADGSEVAASPDFVRPFFGPFTDPVEEVLGQRDAIVDYKVADLQSTVGRLERLNQEDGLLGGRLDLTRIGAMGHSMGGNAALEFCRIDRRCLAAVNLDGANWTEVGRTGLSQPAMLITVDRAEEGPCQESAYYPAALCEVDRAVSADGWRVVAETAQPSYTVSVAGAAHLSFLDIPFLTARPGGQIDAALSAISIDPTRMWRITGDYLQAFFAEHLNDTPAPLLAGDTSRYPEVTFTAGAGQPE